MSSNMYFVILIQIQMKPTIFLIWSDVKENTVQSERATETSTHVNMVGICIVLSDLMYYQVNCRKSIKYAVQIMPILGLVKK